MENRFLAALDATLDFEESVCRKTLGKYEMTDGMRSFLRGSLQAISRARQCPTPQLLRSLLQAESSEVERLHASHYSKRFSDSDQARERRSSMTLLWHLGQYVELETIAKGVNLHTGHNKNGQ